MRAIVFAFLVLLASEAKPQTVKLVGIGATSCRAYVEQVVTRPEVERDYVAWAQGYMSGLLVRAPPGVDEDLDLLPRNFPLEKQADFLRLFCARAPQAEFSEAIQALYKALRSGP